MAETLKSRLTRQAFNWFPCYRRTGARITYVSGDLLEVRIRLPLNWRTRGYWGVIFGGSMYGALDPVLLVMLAKNLGPDYMVWDKTATIEFKKPARSTLYATFRVEPDEIARIKQALGREPRILRTYSVDLVDQNGTVHASCVKTLHIRRRRCAVTANDSDVS
ncbi:MAG: PaaI family thioesterase [Geminicoccaceae bacterium]